jgi:hypothetical protein
MFFLWFAPAVTPWQYITVVFFVKCMGEKLRDGEKEELERLEAEHKKIMQEVDEDSDQTNTLLKDTQKHLDEEPVPPPPAQARVKDWRKGYDEVMEKGPEEPDDQDDLRRRTKRRES